MSMIQTGTIQLNSNSPVETTGGDLSTFTRVIFPTPFPAGSKVIVLPFVQTFNGPETPGLRIADVTNEGFSIRLNEVLLSAVRNIKSDGTHAAETVGWLASTV
ncbi:hypothetical protein GCM10017673_46790 [Streptosporangium violaceochromogenes]|nr:hypothetical protein GCM10017673_46790 [Streptosporangium violaceochromogenes]